MPDKRVSNKDQYSGQLRVCKHGMSGSCIYCVVAEHYCNDIVSPYCYVCKDKTIAQLKAQLEEKDKDLTFLDDHIDIVKAQLAVAEAKIERVRVKRNKLSNQLINHTERVQCVFIEDVVDMLDEALSDTEAQ